MSDYVNAAEAAEILGCSESHVRRHIQSGTLAATKLGNKWQIARADLDGVSLAGTPPSVRSSIRPSDQPSVRSSVHPPAHPSGEDGVHPSVPADWRDDLLAQVARLEASEVALREDASRRESDLRGEVRSVQQELERRDTASAKREERSKARIIDLERELTVRDSRIADLVEQNQILEAKVREILESGKDEALQLANRIADLVAAHEDMQARVVELQPAAEKVPMLQAAVEERDATLSEQQSALQRSEEKLNAIQEDIDAIASRPVTGPVFRMLTKRKLRR